MLRGWHTAKGVGRIARRLNVASRMAHQQRLFLSTLPAEPRERRVAFAVALVSLAVFLAAAPFAKVKLP